MCIMAATRVPGPLPNQLRVYVIPKWNAFNRSARNPDGAEWPVRDGSGSIQTASRPMPFVRITPKVLASRSRVRRISWRPARNEHGRQEDGEGADEQMICRPQGARFSVLVFVRGAPSRLKPRLHTLAIILSPTRGSIHRLFRIRGAYAPSLSFYRLCEALSGRPRFWPPSPRATDVPPISGFGHGLDVA